MSQQRMNAQHTAWHVSRSTCLQTIASILVPIDSMQIYSSKADYELQALHNLIKFDLKLEVLILYC